MNLDVQNDGGKLVGKMSILCGHCAARQLPLLLARAVATAVTMGRPLVDSFYTGRRFALSSAGRTIKARLEGHCRQETASL